LTPKFVRFGWLSSTRTDSIVVADKEERAGNVKTGDEVALSGGGKVKVVGVDGAARRVRLDTPDGPKVLSVDDPKRLIEDTEARRKLIVVGKEFAIVCSPARSDFGKNEAYLGVYSKIHVYKNGEAFDEDARWRVYPIAFPSGPVLSVYLVNDKPIELRPDSPTFAGPAQVFKLVTTWGSSGDLESFGIDDAKGGQSARVAAKGRSSIDLLAGGGPTIASLRGRVTSLSESGAPAASAGSAQPATSPPASSAPPSEPAGPIRSPADAIAAARPHSRWMLGGVAAGFIVAMLLGAFRRRRPTYMDD
jgi:hypothetical protein